MTYSSSGLSAISYANGFTLWHYRTTDTAAEVGNIGYFNGASKMLRPGDFMLVNMDMNNIPMHGVMVVVSNENGVVNASNITYLRSSPRDYNTPPEQR